MKAKRLLLALGEALHGPCDSTERVWASNVLHKIFGSRRQNPRRIIEAISDGFTEAARQLRQDARRESGARAHSDARGERLVGRPNARGQKLSDCRTVRNVSLSVVSRSRDTSMRTMLQSTS